MSAEPQIRIRKLTKADLDRLVEIAAGLKDAPHWPRHVYEAILEPSAPARLALIAEDAATGSVEGFVIASVLQPEAELESIVVSSDHQRRGIARRLFEALVAALAALDVKELVLEVRESNETAQAFYRAAPFVEQGRRRAYYADPVEDAILMKFSLTRH